MKNMKIIKVPGGVGLEKIVSVELSWRHMLGMIDESFHYSYIYYPLPSLL